MQPHPHDSVCVYMCLLIKLLWRAIQHVPWKQGLPWKECFLVDGKRNEDLIPSFSLVLKKDINLCNYWHQQRYSWKTSAWTNRPNTFTVENFWHQGCGDVYSPAFSGQLSSYPSHHGSAASPLRHACDMSFETLQEPEPQQATREWICRVTIPHLLNSHAESTRIFYLADLFFARVRNIFC